MPNHPEHTGTVLMTGFPGFISKHLLRRLVEHGTSDDRYLLLVVEQMTAAAEKTLARLPEEVSSRCEIIVGDITHPYLGLSQTRYKALLQQVRKVWHLAALYNLAVEEKIAHLVNVIGTKHILSFCSACEAFEALFYVSTCYVSGDRKGLIREVELDEGQAFKNHYESTKFWAEVEVQNAVNRENLPAVIFRPGIVVGDSRTGETDKYDGPYTILRLLQRLPDGVPMPNLGDGKAVVNLTPINFAVAAMQTIAGQQNAIGKVFHIADPNPMQVTDVFGLMLETLGKPSAVGRISPWIADFALRFRPVRRNLQVPREALSYFNHDAKYDCKNTTEALSDTDIRCPHLKEYMDVLVEYLQRHPA